MEPGDRIDDQNFGRLLREYRRSAGLTQADLANRSGVSVRGISDLERGLRRSPRRETVTLLADAMSLSPAERSCLISASRRSSRRTARQANLRHISDRVAPLPHRVDAFIGRTSEIAHLTRLLGMPDVRLVTIAGPGGAGKTRLALEVARRLPPHIARTVVFVPLDQVTEPADVQTAIAQSLMIGSVSEDEQLEWIQGFFEKEPGLLVLDNFEHILPAAPVVSRLLRSCGELRVLVTSRAPLSISGEHRFVLPPLSVPQEGLTRSDQARELVDEFDSVRLFVNRAQAIDPSFSLNEANANVVAGICRQLEGLPLAIELAAARVYVLEPAALLRSLQSHMPILTGGARDQPPRLQTMRNAIEWSFDLLPVEYQTFFLGLSVFDGGFAPAQVGAVMGLGSDGSDRLEDIAFLVDQSLVQPVQMSGGWSRFRMIETIREFAIGRLRTTPEFAEVNDRHATVFADLAATMRPELEGPEGPVAMESLQIEHANMQAALNWRLQQGDADGALRLCAMLWKFWMIHGHLRAGYGWLDRAIALPGARDSAYFPDAVYGAGVLARELGQAADAARLGENLRSFAVDRDAVLHQAMALFLLGTLSGRAGDAAMAGEQYEHALHLFGGIENEHGVAMMLHQLATVSRERGDLDAAEKQNAEALSIWIKREDSWGAALALNGLALVDEKRSMRDTAAQHFLAAMDLNARHGSTGNIVTGLEGIARIGANRHPEQALRLFGAADAIRASIGLRAHPAEVARNGPALERIRKRMETEAFESIWTNGEMLTLDEAIAIAETLGHEIQAAPRLQRRTHALSRRELEVLRLVTTGLTDQEIGDVLFISRRTVTTHITSILNKIGVNSRTAAAAIAVRDGLV